jgi:hypothetical protein
LLEDGAAMRAWILIALEAAFACATSHRRRSRTDREVPVRRVLDRHRHMLHHRLPLDIRGFGSVMIKRSHRLASFTW